MSYISGLAFWACFPSIWMTPGVPKRAGEYYLSHKHILLSVFVVLCINYTKSGLCDGRVCVAEY